MKQNTNRRDMMTGTEWALSGLALVNAMAWFAIYRTHQAQRAFFECMEAHVKLITINHQMIKTNTEVIELHNRAIEQLLKREANLRNSNVVPLKKA